MGKKRRTWVNPWTKVDIGYGVAKTEKPKKKAKKTKILPSGQRGPGSKEVA